MNKTLEVTLMNKTLEVALIDKTKKEALMIDQGTKNGFMAMGGYGYYACVLFTGRSGTEWYVSAPDRNARR